MTKRKLFFLALLALGLIGVSGCATKENDDNLSVEELYNKAYDNLEQTNYKKSAELFEKVELEYPYSRWATDAKLMGAYAHYKNETYDDAIMSLDRFIRFHPGNQNVEYAYYLKSMCYYSQISDVNREQGATKNTLISFQQLIARFPNGKYAADARQKIVLANDNLAGKEMEIGRYYLNLNNYLSALNRFSVVVNNYQTTNYVEEALYRQVEIYTILGLNDEAKTAYEVLKYNYPSGEWAKKAAGVVKG